MYYVRGTSIVQLIESLYIGFKIYIPVEDSSLRFFDVNFFIVLAKSYCRMGLLKTLSPAQK